MTGTTSYRSSQGKVNRIRDNESRGDEPLPVRQAKRARVSRRNTTGVKMIFIR